RSDFEEHGISYDVASRPKSDLYEAFEPLLNAGEVELLDLPKLQEQLLTLVWRGSRIDHQVNDHDDWANAAAGVLVVLAGGMQPARHSGIWNWYREEAERRGWRPMPAPARGPLSAEAA